MLTFGGASAVKADEREERVQARTELIQELAEGLGRLKEKEIPTRGNLDNNAYMAELLKYLQERGQVEDGWRTSLLQGMQRHVFDGLDGRNGEKGESGDRGLTGPTGPRGERGLQGPAGEAGPRGERGLQGPAGKDGPRGERGLQGPAGEAGPRGERGLQGPAG
ncbi:collagen-like domain-containing protein, partial [Streptococcus pyogenes]